MSCDKDDVLVKNRDNIPGLRRSSGFATWFFGTYASKMKLKSFHACINCEHGKHVGSFCELYCASVSQIEVCDFWLRKKE